MSLTSPTPRWGAVCLHPKDTFRSVRGTVTKKFQYYYVCPYPSLVYKTCPQLQVRRADEDHSETSGMCSGPERVYTRLRVGTFGSSVECLPKIPKSLPSFSLLVCFCEGLSTRTKSKGSVTFISNLGT